MSETSPATHTTTLDGWKFGSIGKPLPNTESKVMYYSRMSIYMITVALNKIYEQLFDMYPNSKNHQFCKIGNFRHFALCVEPDFWNQGSCLLPLCCIHPIVQLMYDVLSFVMIVVDYGLIKHVPTAFVCHTVWVDNFNCFTNCSCFIGISKARKSEIMILYLLMRNVII